MGLTTAQTRGGSAPTSAGSKPVLKPTLQPNYFEVRVRGVERAALACGTPHAPSRTRASCPLTSLYFLTRSITFLLVFFLPQITVPPSAGAGDKLHATTPGGTRVKISVPAAAKPGMVLTFHVPPTKPEAKQEAAAGGKAAAPAPKKAPAPKEAPAEDKPIARGPNAGAAAVAIQARK